MASDGSNAGARGRDNEPAVRGWWATPGEGRDGGAGLKGRVEERWGRERAVEGEVRDDARTRACERSSRRFAGGGRRQARDGRGTGWWATPGEGRARDARAGLKGDRAVEGEVRDRVEEWSLMATHAVI